MLWRGVNRTMRLRFRPAKHFAPTILTYPESSEFPLAIGQRSHFAVKYRQKNLFL